MNMLANFLCFGAGFWQYRLVSSNIEEIIRVRRYRCRESGVLFLEEWHDEKGELHNTEGPAEIHRDRDTGHVTKISYRENGMPKRADGLPTVERFDEKTGAVVFRGWFDGDPYFRPDGLPHLEYYDPETGKLICAKYAVPRPNPSWRQLGFMLHRTDGPALIEYDRLTGEQTFAEYYINGRRRDPAKIPSLRPEFNP